MLTNLAPHRVSERPNGSSARRQGPDTFDVVLAPLSGITDVPFRRLVRRFGTPVVFSEMVASGELVRRDAESFLRAQRAGDGFHAVQLAGREPRAMEEAARHLAAEGADLIDINMGCPAKKVVGGASGAALMRDLDLARRIIAATKRGAGTVPVSVKMRLGWDARSLNAMELACAARDEGAIRITVHGRTREQFYEGHADWSAIRPISAGAGLPVTANGDLVAAEQMPAIRAASGCASVMIGRGACGRPWAPALLAGRTSLGELSHLDLADLIVEHYEAMLSHYGMSVGVRHARKHLGWYLGHLAGHVGDLSRKTADILRDGDAVRVVSAIRSLFAGISPSDLESSNVHRKAA